MKYFDVIRNSVSDMSHKQRALGELIGRYKSIGTSIYEDEIQYGIELILSEMANEAMIVATLMDGCYVSDSKEIAERDYEKLGSDFSKLSGLWRIMETEREGRAAKIADEIAASKMSRAAIHQS